MSMTMRLDLRQTQNLVLTPQLQQAIKLLQMSTLDVTDAIGKEMLENPFIEVREPGLAQSASERATPGDAGGDQDDGWSQPEPVSGADTRLESRYTSRNSSSSFETRDLSLAESLAQPRNLAEFLVEQIMLDPLEKKVCDVAIALVSWLDEDGYLRETDEEIANSMDCAPEVVTQAREALQACDPAGIGARNLEECLTLQLERIDRCDPAMRTLLKSLPSLARADFAALQRRCRVDAEDLHDMIAEIKMLDPKPGSSFLHQRVDAVIPDVFVHRIGKTSWKIELNEAIQPKVTINESYRSELVNESMTKEIKEYVGERLQSANWLAKALDQRARTILRVSKAIFERQREFLELGPSGLRPLVLRDIASATGLHESTVSRATSDKFVSTPHGTFALKFFFSAAIASAGGEAPHSAEAIRQRIKRLIDAENANNVLSDDRIVEMLREDGIVIARRTVAKYRESLNILSSSKRRRALLLQAS